MAALDIEGFELEMPETEKKATESLINRWLPYILLLASWLITYGRDASGNDALRQQVASDRAVIQTINDKLGTVSDRLARVEATLDSLKRETDTNAAYRDRRQ